MNLQPRGTNLFRPTSPWAWRIRDQHWLRRLQPLLDRRERTLLPLLLTPRGFPFRIERIVERRVLLAVGTLGSGGAERQIVNTAAGLRSRGVDDVHIMVEDLEKPGTSFYLDKARKAAVSVRPVTVVEPPAEWAADRAAMYEVVGGLVERIVNNAAIIRDLSPQVVQISLDWTNISVAMAAVLSGVPHVFMSGRNVSPVNFVFFQWFMYPCYRALSQCPGVHLLNNSDAGRLDYAAWLGLPQDRIKVLRNGLSGEEFPASSDLDRSAARAHFNLSTDAPVVVGVFRLSAEKRPQLWIDTAAEIASAIPGTRFLLCGTGPLEAELKERAQRRGLDAHLTFLGGRSDIQRIMSAADLVMQTSRQEGTPNVLIEAQAMGVPVVTTAAYGAAEAVHDNVTGRVIQSASASELSKAAVAMLMDKPFRERVRRDGPEFIQQRFGIERMTTDTLAVYADAGIGWAAEFLAAEGSFGRPIVSAKS